MRSFALIGLSAVALQGVAATSWRSQPVYSCPKNIKNDCTTDEHQGFDWNDLDVGDFTDYKNYKFQGWKCTDRIGKRNLEGRHFNNKCIESELDQHKFSNEITSHKEFSIGEIDVSVDIDIDVEFHYGMPDGSNCKKVARCSKDGSTVTNDQCGGAKTVKVKIPKRSEQKKCTLGMHKVKFECGKSTTSIPIPTSTIPTSTYTSVPATDVLTTSKVWSSKVRSSKVLPTVSTTSGVPCALCSAPPSEETSYSSAPPAETTRHSGIPSVPFGNSTSYTAPSAPCTKCSKVPPIGDISSAPPAESTSGSAPPSEKTSTSSAPCSACSAIKGSSSSSAPPVKSTSRPALPPVETTPIPPEGAIPTTIAPAPSSGTNLIPGGKQSSSNIWSNTSLPIPSTTPQMPPTNCPETLPRCLKTWLFITSCRDSADPSCFCRSAKFVNQISDCLQSWGKSDSDVEKSVEYFLGLCQPYIHENPAIVTCIPPTVTLPPAPPNVPVQVITRTIVTVVPCEPTVISTATGKGGSPAAGTVVSYTTSTFTSLVTIPQVTLVVTAPEAHLEYPKVPATNFAPHVTPSSGGPPAHTANVPANNLGAITTRVYGNATHGRNASGTGVPEQYTGGAAPGFGAAVMAGVLGAVGVVVFQL